VDSPNCEVLEAHFAHPQPVCRDVIRVPDLLSFPLAHDATRAAVIGVDRTLSFAAVHARANQLVAVLQARGLRVGDRVALLARNEVEYFEIQIAASRGGFVLVPINFRLAPAEIAHILNDSQPGVLIHGPGFEVGIEAWIPMLALGGTYDEALSAEAAADVLPLPVDAGAACVILYTSGTTGRPKGAVLTNHALLARINANLFDYEVNTSDTFLQCLPMFHIASMVSYSYLAAGGTNVLLKDFSVEAVLDLIARHQVTAALMVPTMINTLVNSSLVDEADHASLRTLIYGASPIPPVVLARAIEKLSCRFYQAFGMTETSAVTLLRPTDHDPVRQPGLLASAGTPAMGMVMRLVDDRDEDVQVGETGEVICQGPAVMEGYWRNPEATAEAMRGGWMHTGDLGYRDVSGYLFVTDRKKDMIISGGENVYPREVEDVLFEHADILEAAVIGVPDERWGERVHAVIVAKPGALPELQEVLQFVRSRLAGYKAPKSAELVDALPKNATGKVLKTELRKRFWDGQTRNVN